MREYQPSLVRVARIYVSNQAAAEDVAAETWLGVLKGLDRFEGRSSLRTWIFRILTNIAKTRAVRDGRTLPFSALQDPGRVPEAAAVTTEDLLATLEADIRPTRMQCVTLPLSVLRAALRAA